jgi:hypothetical protein
MFSKRERELSFQTEMYLRRKSKSASSLSNRRFLFLRIFDSAKGGMAERESNERFEKFAEIFETIKSMSNCPEIDSEHRKIIKIVSRFEMSFDSINSMTELKMKEFLICDEINKSISRFSFEIERENPKRILKTLSNVSSNVDRSMCEGHSTSMQQWFSVVKISNAFLERTAAATFEHLYIFEQTLNENSSSFPSNLENEFKTKFDGSNVKEFDFDLF